MVSDHHRMASIADRVITAERCRSPARLGTARRPTTPPPSLLGHLRQARRTSHYGDYGYLRTGCGPALITERDPTAGQGALAQLSAMCQEQALATFAGKRIQDY